MNLLGFGVAAFTRFALPNPVRLRFRCAQATPDTLRPNVLRLAAPRVARQGEAWWACLDSNQEPDRYERPALTIELQAPPMCRFRRLSNGADTPYNVAGDPAMPLV
jgi:hypothetical protein